LARSRERRARWPVVLQAFGGIAAEVTCFRAVLEKQSSWHTAAKEWERGADCQHALAYDDDKLAEYLRRRAFTTIMAADIKFGKDGE
jgi:hypothetical protein